MSLDAVAPTDTRPPRATSPLDDPASPLSQALRQPLLLGTFLKLAQDNVRPRDPPGWTWDANLATVLEAERLGFELAFAPMRWLPHDENDTVSLDAFLSVAAMTGATKRILLVSTLHVLYGPLHPLHIAKWGATLDHVSRGRWGLNIVTGHRAVEHEMFGWPQIEHDHRYLLADELLDAVERLWAATGNFSAESTRGQWRFKDGYASPKPRHGRPILVAATGSDAGIDFAANHADLIFVTSPGGPVLAEALATLPAHNARIKAAARAVGRDVRTVINPVIVTAASAEAAERRAQAIQQAGPADLARYASDAHAWRGRTAPDRQRGRGLGGNVELIGDPAQIADQLLQLHRTGIDGVQISFPEPATDLPFFGEQVLPRLKALGLRL